MPFEAVTTHDVSRARFLLEQVAHALLDRDPQMRDDDALDRKPNGYDTACLRNGFGQEDHLRVVDKRTAPAAAAVPSAA